MTALMWACQFGHKYVVKLLLEHPDKIELNARNDNGETALNFAYEQKDIYQLFLDDPNIQRQCLKTRHKMYHK